VAVSVSSRAATVGSFESFWEAAGRADRPRDGCLHVWDGREFESWTWAEWQRRAERASGALWHLGVRPRDHVAMIISNSPDSVAALFGAWMCGASVISCPTKPNGADGAWYTEAIGRIVRESEAAWLLCEPEVVDSLREAAIGAPIIPMGIVRRDWGSRAPSRSGARVALVQYTSGSTRDPRGCVLTFDAIASQMRALSAKLEIDPARDVAVFWLPLSHDMGLFGGLMLGLSAGHRVVLGTPARFAVAPTSWLADCARFQATISATPAFGLAVAAHSSRTLRSVAPFPMRRMVVGGDRIDARSLTRSIELLGPDRVSSTSVVPAYGLAEAVLAVTVTPPGAGPTSFTVDRDALREGVLTSSQSSGAEDRTSTTFVNCGTPLDDYDVSIAGGGDIGEIVVRGPGLADGYLNQPEVSREKFDHGLHTGDIGFLHDDSLFVVGRADDLLSVGGRNVFARDLEIAIAGIDEIKPGGIAVVGVDAGARIEIVALVEASAPISARRPLAAQIDQQARRVSGVAISRCVFLEPGSLPKTPSGKVRRHDCRELAAAPASGPQHALAGDGSPR
jgi:fatty-acyl-CoA synthase